MPGTSTWDNIKDKLDEERKDIEDAAKEELQDIKDFYHKEFAKHQEAAISERADDVGPGESEDEYLARIQKVPGIFNDRNHTAIEVVRPLNGQENTLVSPPVETSVVQAEAAPEEPTPEVDPTPEPEPVVETVKPTDPANVDPGPPAEKETPAEESAKTGVQPSQTDAAKEAKPVEEQSK